MNSFIRNMQQHNARTANGAITHKTSTNNVLDLFFLAGACRNVGRLDIENALDAAWAEDANLTLKLIFWGGDIRGGAGERRFFRLALSWLEGFHKADLLRNIQLIPEYNRWDSVMLFETDEVRQVAIELCRRALVSEQNGLCAKWMPRRKQHDNFAQDFRARTGFTPKGYRKLITGLSKTVEQDMCAGEWDDINFSHVPSVASNKYRTAFYRHQEARFGEFIDKVTAGDPDVKINASAIFPHDIYKAWEIKQYSSACHTELDKAIDAQWNSLPDFIGDSGERILPMCDVSGSMTMGLGLPMQISIALGIYCSQRNVGPFQDAILSFTDRPELNVIKGTPCERFRQFTRGVRMGYSTNLQRAFDSILDTAVRNSIPVKDMPTMILVISDMEFDSGCVSGLTNYEHIVKCYANAGYDVPKMVFWNVNGRPGNVPVSNDTCNVGLVSGASPAIMKSVLGGDDFSPEGIMLQTLQSERYSQIQ